MTILATQEWVTPESYLIERSTFWGVALIWWSGCVLNAGRDFINRETPFGGYRVRMTIDDTFWNSRSSAWRHDEILENLYAMSPSSDTPISVGAVKRQVVFYPSLLQYVCVIQCEPNGVYYRFQAFPFAPENAGAPNPPPDIPDLFFSDPAYPGVILPPVFC